MRMTVYVFTKLTIHDRDNHECPVNEDSVGQMQGDTGGGGIIKLYVRHLGCHLLVCTPAIDAN